MDGVPPVEGEAKRFGRNFASAAFAQLVAQVLTLGASILIAREIDVRAYGIFVFGFAFPSWFLLLVSLGLDEVMAVEVAADRSKAARYLTLVSLIRLLLAFVALVALWLATNLIVTDPLGRSITLVLGASGVVMTCGGTFTAVFRSFERIEYAALVTIVERSVTVGAVVLLLLFRRGLFEISIAFLGGSFVMLALSSLLARRKFAWYTRDVDVKTVVEILRLATPFGLFNAVGTFTYSTGLVLLTLWHGPESGGLFNASFTLVFALFSFLSIVSLTTLPMMSRINQESRERLGGVIRRMQKLSLAVGVPLALGGWLFAGEIVTTFYGSAFQASADSFRILLVSFAIETAIMGIGPALAATGHAKEKLYIATGGAAVTIALSIVLIPGYGLLGAAYAFLASRLLIAVLGTITIQRYVGPLRMTATMGKCVVAGSAMMIALVAVPGLTLWVGIPVGGLVYLATLLGIQGMTREDGRVVWEGIRGALFR